MNGHEFWNELGNLYFMSGAYEPAIHAYLRSIQLNGRFGRSYSNLALAFVHTGKYADAIKLYRHSIGLLPDVKEKAITWNRLGILYRQMKDYKNALEAYQQADVLDPQQNDAREGFSGGTKLPLTVSMPAIDIGSLLDGQVAANDDGIIVPVEKDTVKVKPARAQVKPPWFDDDLVPLDPEIIWQEMENKKQNIEMPIIVRSEWKSAAEDKHIEPSNEVMDHLPVEMANESMAGMSQIVAMVETGMVQYAQTEDPLPELSKSEPSPIELEIAKYKAETINNPKNVSGWETLGDTYKSAGMYKDAIQAFKTAISLNSTRPSYYYRLGLTYAAERREAEAILAFEKVLELDRNHALAHASLGSHYLKMGRDELAQFHIKQALSTNFSGENEYNQACLEAICGNADHALELLRIALETKQTHVNWARNDPDLDSLHDDHRFNDILSAYSTSEK